MVNNLEKALEAKPSKQETGVDKNPLNLAASWYVAMQSKDLGKKPKAIELFGESLVAWRDQNGQPVIMERYCSHRGTSLAIGKVKDGCIQCPFHHWRYDNSGNCVFIFELDHIPPTARQVTYVTQEKYGYIWVWYGTQTPLFPLPKFSVIEEQSHNYMFLYETIDTQTSVRQVMENPYDPIHASTLHALKTTDPIQFTLFDDQHFAEQFKHFTSKEALIGSSFEVPLQKYPGLISGILTQLMGLNTGIITIQTYSWPSGLAGTSFIGGEEKWQFLILTTPVAKNKTVVKYLIMIKKSNFFWQNILNYLFVRWQNKITFMEDVMIWNNMKQDAGGAYTKHDRGVLKFMEFYQRWVDQVEV